MECVGESEKRINYTHIARTFHTVFIRCTRLIEANDEAALNRGGCNSFADAHRIFVCPSSINHLNHSRMNIYMQYTKTTKSAHTTHLFTFFSSSFSFCICSIFTDFYRKCLAAYPLHCQLPSCSLFISYLSLYIRFVILFGNVPSLGNRTDFLLLSFLRLFALLTFLRCLVILFA